MEEELRSLREQLDYAHSLARLRDAELQELRARVGRAATGCCAAMCGVPSWSSESGELVALPNCEHCLHSDCLLQLLTPYCPQCRNSVAKSPEAKTHLAINSDFIIRERERVEAEAEARREAAREAQRIMRRAARLRQAREPRGRAAGEVTRRRERRRRRRRRRGERGRRAGHDVVPMARRPEAPL